MRTALYEAIKTNQLEIVKLLIRNGADVAQAMFVGHGTKVGIFDSFIFARGEQDTAQILNILLTYGAQITMPIANFKHKYDPNDENEKVIQKHNHLRTIR